MLPEPLRAALGVESAEKLPGGAIVQCYWATVGGVERFLKTGAERYADQFAAEADGLAALRRAGARAPEAVSHGVAGGRAYLLIEHLELRVDGDYAALGGMLARMHRSTGERHGWARDNYIGVTTQDNRWCDDWVEFWRERRLRPQFELARRNGFALDWSALEQDLGRWIGHRPAPSLLHGDLWNGNAGFREDGPVIFDPSVYHGDREADVAMTELFGGFPGAFYEAYNAEWPLPAGYEERKNVYNLYHLLNHLNIFGGEYLGQVKSALGLLRGLGL